MRKKSLLLLAALMLLVIGCKQGGNSPQITETNESEDSLDYSMEFGTISDIDQWLRVDPADLKSEQTKRLADAYNAFVVLNSLITDFDLQMRFGLDPNDVIEPMEKIDVTKVKDPEVVAKLKAYKKEMIYLLTVNPDDVDMSVHNPWKASGDLYNYLSKKYYVSTFGKFDADKYLEEYDICSSVPEWKELMEKRIDGNEVESLKRKFENAKDFDARCIYAIELAHAYEADIDAWDEDDSQNPAIPIMEELMKEKQYSLYLNELWLIWRTLYQHTNGASKDSEILNGLYNDYRNICACTILSYIEEHPQDIKAVNEFLVIACKKNILRYGEFEYGNQNALEYYSLFSEFFQHPEEKE